MTIINYISVYHLGYSGTVRNSIDSITQQGGIGMVRESDNDGIPTNTLHCVVRA